MSPKSFPVAWHADSHRFVGKAYVDHGSLFLTGSEMGIRRRRRDLEIAGADVTSVATHRVAGLPGLAVRHRSGLLEIELLSGSWGAARELADSVASVSAFPQPKTGERTDAPTPPVFDDSWRQRNHPTRYEEVLP
jgi:hypothetical protein